MNTIIEAQVHAVNDFEIGSSNNTGAAPFRCVLIGYPLKLGLVLF